MTTIKLDEMTALDRLCLDALTTGIKHSTVVMLASTIWNPDKRYLLGADPIGLTQYLVEGLAERGLVKFNLHENSQHNMSGLAFDIRLTQDGWALMGYPNIHRHIGTRLSSGHRMEKVGDLTEFRKHGWAAEGGAIEVDTFGEHKLLFPEHVHDYEMNGDDMPRTYMRMTDDIENQIRSYHDEHPQATPYDIGEALAYSERTVRYVLYDLPRIRRNSNDEHSDASLKERIVLALAQTEYDNVTELRKVLGRTDTSHDIVHVLHSLHSEGRVDFIEDGARKQPKRIRLTNRGAGQLQRDRTIEDLKKQPPMTVSIVTTPGEMAEAINGARVSNGQKPFDIGANGMFIEGPDPDQMAVDAAIANLELNDFPLLDSLEHRERERKQHDQKGLRYLEAAEILRATDPETAALLDQKAAESDFPFPTPLEAEYLAYAAKHARRAYPDEERRRAS